VEIKILWSFPVPELSQIPERKSILDAIRHQLSPRESFDFGSTGKNNNRGHSFENFKSKDRSQKSEKKLFGRTGNHLHSWIVESSANQQRVAKSKASEKKPKIPSSKTIWNFKRSNAERLYAAIEISNREFLKKSPRSSNRLRAAIANRRGFSEKWRSFLSWIFDRIRTLYFGGKEKLKSLETPMYMGFKSIQAHFLGEGTLKEVNWKVTGSLYDQKDFLWKKLSLIAVPKLIWLELVDWKRKHFRRLAKRKILWFSEGLIFLLRSNGLQYTPSRNARRLWWSAFGKG